MDFNEQFDRQMKQQERMEKRWLRLAWVISLIVVAPFIAICCGIGWLVAADFL